MEQYLALFILLLVRVTEMLYSTAFHPDVKD
jgi:hypothetical protein